jgi:hypothetical protein
MSTRPDKVESRADGRPPEEAESDSPEEQAEVILAESEERLEQGAARSIEKAQNGRSASEGGSTGSDGKSG